jgi:flavin-dependent dehydrogenase
MTVRKELDDYCLRQTMGVGAQFTQIGAIETISEDSSGVTLRVDRDTMRARFVVGADGVHSRVRQLTDKRDGWFWRGFALEGMVPFPDAAAQELIFDFAPVRDGYGWIFPKGDHLNVGLYSYSPEERIDRSRLADYIRSRCGSAAAEDVIGQYAGFGAAQHKIAATRIFLVGDAGGFVDPLTGEGIYFAVASGQAAARAIETSLHDGVAAQNVFAQGTAQLRADLAMTTSAARWFYRNLDQACQILSISLLHSTILKAFANGFNPAKLAGRVRRLGVKN